MAETVVNIVIDKLVPLLTDEVTLFRGVHGQMASIKDQLGLIKAYLKDADQKAEMADTNNLVKEWVKQMRELAYRIEDVIDEYLFKVAKRGKKHGLLGVLSKISHLLKSIIPRYNIISEIDGIRESIDRLNRGKETFGFNPSIPESSSQVARISTKYDLRLGALFMDDSQLVGVDQTRKTLADWLLNKETRRTVISVVGEGGLGKTTIVNNVYKKQKEKRTFDCYAWITVSRSLKEEKLLKAMIQSLYEGDDNKYASKEINETMDKTILIRELREYLQGRSYMIVFDDVWDISFWDDVEFALPNNNNCGRIMITTRDRGVAEFCKRFAPVHIHNLEPLSPNDALKLFHLKAFQFDPEGCPEELKELSEDFVKKCEGVPLAIEAIAGLLSTKMKNASEWQRVHNSLHSKLSSDPHFRYFYQVLSESYNDLPYHLKLCLLYFGLFPEDYSIGCVKLINLWIAEGFVKQKENEDQTLEEVAEEYLTELIRRSLVKVSLVYAYGRVRRCRLHDLMHNFIFKKCEELNFCQVKKNEGFSLHAWTRRLSINTNSIDASLQRATNYGRVRSCFVFNLVELPNPVADSMLSSFKLLIGLDLEDAPLDYLPESVGNLLHLKYLSIKSTKVKIIPKFIGKLQNLETLDIKNTQVSELPLEINKLVKLRHLIAYSSQYPIFVPLENILGVTIKEGIERLRALQKLLFVDVTDGDSIINELKNLKQLRRLGIIKLRRHQGKLLCSAIESMNNLRSLCIAAVEQQEILDLQTLNAPPQYLQRLYLEGRIETLPQWIPKLKNVMKLRLSWSGLKEDPLYILKDLPELLQLLIYNSYEGDELHFKDGWFKKLKALRFRSLPRLKTLKIDQGALPLLKELQLALCPQMVDVPADIQNLESLTEFSVREMPQQFINDIDSMKGKGYDIIRSSPWVICVKNAEDFNVQNLGFLNE